MKSEAQRKFLWANHPEIAERWEQHTPKGEKLPDHVKKAYDAGALEALQKFSFDWQQPLAMGLGHMIENGPQYLQQAQQFIGQHPVGTLAGAGAVGAKGGWMARGAADAIKRFGNRVLPAPTMLRK